MAAIAREMVQPANPVTVLSPLEVIRRLTPSEEAALVSSTDLAVRIVCNRLIAAGEVRSDDPLTIEGVRVLVEKGIITRARAEQVFQLPASSQ